MASPVGSVPALGTGSSRHSTAPARVRGDPGRARSRPKTSPRSAGPWRPCKVLVKWGLRSLAFQMRCTLSGDIPTAWAIERTLQRVARLRRLRDRGEDLLDLVRRQARRPAPPLGVGKSRQALAIKALRPLVHTRHADAQLRRHLHLLDPLGPAQDDSGAS